MFNIKGKQLGQGSKKGKVEWFVSLFKTKLTLISIRNKRDGVVFNLKYCISLNNSSPSSNCLPQIIALL